MNSLISKNLELRKLFFSLWAAHFKKCFFNYVPGNCARHTKWIRLLSKALTFLYASQDKNQMYKIHLYILRDKAYLNTADYQIEDKS